MMNKNKYELFEGRYVFVLHKDGDHESTASGILKVIDEKTILIVGGAGRVMIDIESITKVREKSENGRGY